MSHGLEKRSAGIWMMLIALLVAPTIPAAAADLADCLANPGVPDSEGFVHRPQVELDGQIWYLLGPELELMGIQAGQPQDVPGHCWKQGADLNGNPRFLGKHFNTGPLGAGAPPRFWSSDAEDHEQLYWADIVLTRWSPAIALGMSNKGYVHQHELVLAGDGCLHPDTVVWFRHAALKEFTFDGGPPRMKPDGTLFRPRNIPHHVDPGIDFSFPPQYDIPYDPPDACD